METDDRILFGGYEWRILDIQSNAALLITEEVIETRAYHNRYIDSIWADCEIRKYLNGEFYDKFNATDKSRIIYVTNINDDNQWYDGKGGNDTQDKIFLLSIEEVSCKYFGDSSEILKNPGKHKYKYWFNKKDANNIIRAAPNGCWWLRSPGRTNRHAAYVHGYTPSQLATSAGSVGVNGNNITSTNGVRPALWLTF